MPILPRISGTPLKALAYFAGTGVGRATLQWTLRRDIQVDKLRVLDDSMRAADLPLDNRPRTGRSNRIVVNEGLPVAVPEWAPTSDKLTALYRTGALSPVDMATKALEAARSLAQRTPSLGPLSTYADDIARRDAHASLERYRLQSPRGPLDGVPFVVKEQTAVAGLPRRIGTQVLDETAMENDATMVKRLRKAGAIVLGMSSMTEFGMTPSGANPFRAMPRNAHNPNCLPGGSSTGSGVAVALGVVPFATAADGGGSIRIPAAMNGVFGIKPTWGRISREGDAATGSVSHVGPIASSTKDLAYFLEATCGEDLLDGETSHAPSFEPGEWVHALERGVKGLKVAVDEHEWGDASSEVAKAGEEMLRTLEKEGATLVPATLKLARHASAIGCVVISAEARAILGSYYRRYRKLLSEDLQVTLSAIEAFTAVEYLEVLRLRVALRYEIAQLFENADLLALPSTVSTAPTVTEVEMRTGFLDPDVINGMCRFCFLANLTGSPALSAPVGNDSEGRPIGFQLVGDAWDEASVLAGAAHLERIGAARVEKPTQGVDLL